MCVQYDATRKEHKRIMQTTSSCCITMPTRLRERLSFMPEACLESGDARRQRYPRAKKRFADQENACFAPKMTRPQPPRMVNTTCSSFQFAGLPGSSQGYATLGGALGSAVRNSRRRVKVGWCQDLSKHRESDERRDFTSGARACSLLGRHPRALGRVEKYPTAA